MIHVVHELDGRATLGSILAAIALSRRRVFEMLVVILDKNVQIVFVLLALLHNWALASHWVVP